MAAKELRILARKAPNESEVVLSVLPMTTPIRELFLDGDISTTPNQKWHGSVMMRPSPRGRLTGLQPFLISIETP